MLWSRSIWTLGPIGAVRHADGDDQGAGAPRQECSEGEGASGFDGGRFLQAGGTIFWVGSWLLKTNLPELPRAESEEPPAFPVAAWRPITPA